jgi:cytochrome c1
MKSLIAVALLGAMAIAQDTTSRSVWDGVYTQEQAQRGQSSYNQYCMACHGGSLTVQRFSLTS